MNYREDAQELPILGNLSQSKILSVIKPPLDVCEIA